MSEPEPQPAAPPPSPPFQFRLRTLFLLVFVLAASLAAFGAVGVAVFAMALGLASYLHEAKWSLTFLLLVLLWLIGVLGLLRAAEPGLNWPNIAALAVWLLSVGTLLTGAVRGRKGLSSRAAPPSG